MNNQKDKLTLPGTDSGPKPGDFPLGRRRPRRRQVIRVISRNVAEDSIPVSEQKPFSRYKSNGYIIEFVRGSR
jgi:hypothetical protein